MNKDALQHKNKDELISLTLLLSQQIIEKQAQEKTLSQQLKNQEKTFTQQIANQSQQITEHEHTIAQLQFQLDKLLRNRFGKKSEKDLDSRQGELFDEACEPDNTQDIVQAEVDITVPTHQRKKTGRKPLPDNLPRVEQVHDIDDNDKVCACGCTLTPIGQDTSEQLDIIPAKVQVIKHIKLKYACKACEQTIATAKLPPQPIPQSIATPGTLAYVITAKFCDGLPLYRQEAIFQRMGIDIARNTLSHWVIKTAELLRPLYQCLQHQLITYDVAFADETRVQVLKEPDRPAEAKSYMWCFVGGPPDKRTIMFHYNQSRAHTVIEDMLEDFSGFLHCDGFVGYDTYASDHEVELVGCWMHGRRKFYEVANSTRSQGLAHQAVKLIAKLYKVETAIKAQDLSYQDIVYYRLKHAKPIVDKLRKFIDDNMKKILPKSPLGEAFSYAHNQWAKLTRYLKDGRLDIDNGLTERAIKPFVIGRKNFLFCDSIAGARAAEVLYSLIETCKANKVEPYAYLRTVLAAIPSAQTIDELEQLMPYHINT